jgi:alkylation response protein AidB-like acyl-CoA dehydrogenase
MSTKLNLESSVIKSLFLGNILEENIFPYPVLPSESAETIRMVVESLDKFMGERHETYREYDREGYQPDDYIEALKELGLFGLIIPEEFGGLGLSNSGYARVIGQTSYHDASTALTIGAHSSIGLKGLLLFGTEEQKAKYLPRLATGEWIAAFCLTEPGAGSDAASIKTHAVRNEDGSWNLSGEKIWITNGAFANFFTVFARTDTAEGKITAFIVERDFEGVANGPKEDKLGIRASATTTVSFSNVKIPAENILGGVGNGFKVAMAILNNGRTGLGGGCVGAMKRVIAAATEQAVNRKQFGKSIAEFGLIQEKLALMNVQCFAAESIVSVIGHYIDSDVADYSLEAAASKIYCSEALWNVVNEGLQIAGGNGFMKEYPYERIMRDSRINLIFEGTNEILRLYIGLSSLKDVGEYLEGVKKSSSQIFSDPIKGFGTLSKFVTKRVGTLTSFGRDRIESAHPLLAEEVATIEKYTTRLSTASETVLMRLGKKIVDDQFRTKRLADISIDLFSSLCVLSRVSSIIKEVGEENSQEERMIARVFVRQAKRRINGNLRRLISNEDKEMKALSESLVKAGRYRWDSI